ncbi:hypothetical protein RclHR1_03630003 [Rhizophagus clarus]|uniref:Uncharacterized protein n=1 Tax=Rhizophagus clarus TaxID=94130 RepID=A0A2Z6RBF4_9GLOM|nr:hypothetical protein RclHR1_03630003 [Rhizophagus clarus]
MGEKKILDLPRFRMLKFLIQSHVYHNNAYLPIYTKTKYSQFYSKLFMFFVKKILRKIILLSLCFNYNKNGYTGGLTIMHIKKSKG